MITPTVSIAAPEQPVGTIQDEITKKPGIKIAYDPEDIRRLPPVSGEFKKAAISDVLDRCIAGSRF